MRDDQALVLVVGLVIGLAIAGLVLRYTDVAAGVDELVDGER